MKNMTDSVSSLSWLVSNKDSILPGYVPAMPSMKVAGISCLSIFLLGTFIAMIDMYVLRKHAKSTMRLRWILIQLITLYITVKLFPLIQRKVYIMDNLQRNKQHFANVFWLKEYMESFRLIDGSVAI